LIELAALDRPNALLILSRYDEDETTRWLAYVLDRGVDNPAAYLISCCVRKHEPAPAYTPDQVRRILSTARGRPDVSIDEPPERAQPIKASEPDPHLHEIWRSCTTELKLQMTPATYTTHLAGSRLVDIDPESNVATLAVRDCYAAEWVETRLAPRVLAVLGPIAAGAGLPIDPDLLTLACTVAEAARAPPARASPPVEVPEPVQETVRL